MAAVVGYLIAATIATAAALLVVGPQSVVKRRLIAARPAIPG